VTPPRVFARVAASARDKILPALLLVFGAALALLIVLRLNPWNGSLWMIGSFCALVVVEARARASQRQGGRRGASPGRHDVPCGVQLVGPCKALGLPSASPSRGLISRTSRMSATCQGRTPAISCCF
jgi:hypothetical protein